MVFFLFIACGDDTGKANVNEDDQTILNDEGTENKSDEITDSATNDSEKPDKSNGNEPENDNKNDPADDENPHHKDDTSQNDDDPEDPGKPDDEPVDQEQPVSDADEEPGDPEPEKDRCAEDGAVHVAKTGSDSAECGDENAPCLTIKQGIKRVGTDGAVCVHEGTYNEGWTTLKSDMWLISADGIGKAKIYSGNNSAVRLSKIENSGIDGFEVYGNWNQGNASDGLIRVLDATDVTLRNLIAHDAPFDMDVIKVSGKVKRLLIENVIAWNPAKRNMNGEYYQEVIDIFGSNGVAGEEPPVSDVVVRGCWLFHRDGKGDWLIYSKINAEKIIYENNVFGPSAGNGWGNAAVGIGTGEPGIPDSTAAVVTHAIVRNNIFSGCRGDGAFAVMNAENSWVYNNTFYKNSDPKLRSLIMIRSNSHQVGPTYIFNNIFSDNHPAKSDPYFFWIRGDLPATWYLDYNLYHQNIAKTGTPYNSETHGIYDTDPQLEAPAVPDISNPTFEQLAKIRENFGISNSSPAKDKGINPLSIPNHPNYRPGVTDKMWDYEKEKRPSGNGFDMGADEIQ